MTISAEKLHLEQQGLYAADLEHDACGVGFVAHMRGAKSHDIVTQALKILENLDHRGAVGADKLMGDGAGILIQIPDALYREEMAKQGVALPPAGEYGVGMIFLPKEHASRMACEQEMERAIKAERDRRKAGGVKVGSKWFHSDDGSRIQQMGLVMMGAGIPANLQWKTMDGSFITMTQTLASQVFQAVAASDQAIFTVAEQHKATMEASADPASYDYSGGWPKIYGE